MATQKNPAVDAVLVGFGWTGAIMGMELTAAGLKVLALERGEMRDTNPDFAYPRITLVPAAMKIVGLPAGAGSGPVVVDQPVSYFGLNALLGDMLRDSPFTPGSRPLAERMAHLETTAFASENGDMLVMRDAAGQYRMRTDKGVWVPYNP